MFVVNALMVDVLMNNDSSCEVFIIWWRATLWTFFLFVLLILLFLIRVCNSCRVYRCRMDLRWPVTLCWYLTLLPARMHGYWWLTNRRYIDALVVDWIDRRRWFVIVHDDRLIGAKQTLLSDILYLLFSLLLCLVFLTLLHIFENFVTAIYDAAKSTKSK